MMMIFNIKGLSYFLSFGLASSLMQHNDYGVHLVAVKPEVTRPVSP
jgi:hypothetical protein